MAAVYRKDDPAFWDHGPGFLAHVNVVAREFGNGFAMFSLADDPDTSPEAPLAAVFYMPPGAVLAQHAHDCHRVEVVVKGTITLPDGQVLEPGDVAVSAPNEFYGPHVAGPNGSLTVEIFSRAHAVEPAWADEGGEMAKAMREK